MLPIEFEKRMKEMLGEEYEDFLKGYDKPRFHGVRRNPLKITKEEFEALLPFSLKAVDWCSAGYYYSPQEQPGKHPFHAAGLYYIQEPSAMAVAEYLAPFPGERVLDLCGAPGGKSTALAAAMEQKGLLVCNEIHPARAKILSENIERMGIGNAIVTNEIPERLAEYFPGFFDKILVDAPCSGEGMFRKNQEALTEWSLDNVQMCADRQDEILREVVKMLRPGGKLCYSTCTFAPGENEECTERFLEHYPQFHLLALEKKGGMESGNPNWTKKKDPEIEKTLRLWPHKLDGEGHYIALYEKRGEEAYTKKVSPLKGRDGKERGKEPESFRAFVQENLTIDFSQDLLLFGEQLYLLPKDCPDLRGFKVLRPGLHLGTLKKNRFEPSHALALYLKKEQVCYSYNMKADSKEVRDYLSGGTLPLEGKKGWYLMLVEGYSIGWAKLAGGILKNHYPKGLRK